MLLRAGLYDIKNTAAHAMPLDLEKVLDDKVFPHETRSPTYSHVAAQMDSRQLSYFASCVAFPDTSLENKTYPMVHFDQGKVSVFCLHALGSDRCWARLLVCIALTLKRVECSL